MHLVFLNPLWLLAALVAVPLLAHLFSRARPHRRVFPSLQLLREAMRHVTRVRRPRDRWLLILRTLAMLALILAFLQPWLLSRFASGNGTTKTVVLVVDATASMAYADGTRTRLAQATASAEEVLATLPPNSRANIIWVQAHASGVLPEPGPNLNFLKQALRTVVAQAQPGDPAGALDLAIKQLKDASGDRELVVLSDFQKSDWAKIRWEVPQGIRLTRISTGTAAAANLGLAGLTLEPARPVVGQEVRLSCRVRNFSNEPHRVTVFVEAGESRLSQAVDITPWSETLALWPLKFAREGLTAIKVSLADDRYVGDNVLYGLAPVRGSLQVGIAGAARDVTARVWSRAAAALDGVTSRMLTFEELESASAFDVLLVSDWNGQAPATLRNQLKRGGALVVLPADGLDSAAVRPLVALDDKAAAPPLRAELHETPGWPLRVANESHPVFALFAGGAFGDPANAKFRRRLTPLPFLNSSPLLSFQDGQSALTLSTTSGQGPLAWWNLDLNSSDWSSRPAFLPFFGEFLRFLGSGSGGAGSGGAGSGGAGGTGGNGRNVEPGERLVLETAAALEASEVRLVNEREEELKTAAESARTPGRLTTAVEPAPGSYRWLAHGNVVERAVINFPESESDLRQLSAADLGSSAGAVLTNAAGDALLDLREGKPLWAWCLIAAAVFLLLEGLCLWRLPKIAVLPEQAKEVV